MSTAEGTDKRVAEPQGQGMYSIKDFIEIECGERNQGKMLLLYRGG